MKKYKAICISDIHLGSNTCAAKELLSFLEKIEEKTDKLILNGDIFDSLNLKRLQKSHWKIVSKLRNLSKNIEIIGLEGNHDEPCEHLSNLLGLNIHKEYILNDNILGKILFLHGHIFDKFIHHSPFLTSITDFIYHIVQKLDRKQSISRWVKRTSKKYLNCKNEIRKSAIQYALHKECDFVIASHTHFAEKFQNYYNTGCWTDIPCTYIAISDQIEILKH